MRNLGLEIYSMLSGFPIYLWREYLETKYGRYFVLIVSLLWLMYMETNIKDFI